MVYKIYPTDSTKLLSLPETGMGYQIIEGKIFDDNRIRKYVAYNCELVIDFDEEFQVNRKQIVDRGFSTVLKEAKYLLIITDSIKTLSRSSNFEYRELSPYKQSQNKRHSGGRGAKDNPKEYSKGDETFVRISAYEKDKRIDFIRKRLVEGSYTTTLSDYYDCIISDDEPIDRYALPNDEKIKWAFYVRPTSFDVLQRGVVQPAFGHEGGGIEVFFEDGTADNTYYLKKEYGTL
jgi:hypothetical protein